MRSHAVALWIDIDTIERAKLPQWIGQRLAHQKQKASAEALEFIAERVEGNLLAAHQEIAKLSLLYPAGEVSLEQVHDAVMNVARYDVFQLPVAMVAGDAARVGKTMAGLRAEGEAIPLVLLGDHRGTADAASGQVAGGRRTSLCYGRTRK